MLKIFLRILSSSINLGVERLQHSSLLLSFAILLQSQIVFKIMKTNNSKLLNVIIYFQCNKFQLIYLNNKNISLFSLQILIDFYMRHFDNIDDSKGSFRLIFAYQLHSFFKYKI